MSDTPILPTVHLGGTSLQALFKDYEQALLAAEHALDVFDSIEFNSRDYLLGNWDAAIEQRAATRGSLRTAVEYLREHLNHLYEIQQQRDARKA